MRRQDGRSDTVRYKKHPLPNNVEMEVCQNLSVAFWGVPMVRAQIFWGLYWVPPIVRNCQMWFTIVSLGDVALVGSIRSGLESN